MLTDTFFHEAATAEEVEEEAPRFNQWAKRFADRSFFSRYWDDVSRMESEPGAFVHPREIIHREFSHVLREAVRAAGVPWNAASGEEFRSVLVEKDERVRKFQNLCANWSRAAMQKQPNWRRLVGSLEKERELIQQPDYVTDFVQRINIRMRGAEWKKHLGIFPDRHAVGRWARLVAWYALQHSFGRTRDFANNLFDAEYAFAASYVGRLATTDKGLIAATEAVFPSVQIYPPRP